MTIEPGERRRRRELERARELAVEESAARDVPRQAGPVPGVPQQASSAGAPADDVASTARPLSRRELREHERRRAAAAGEEAPVDREPMPAPDDRHGLHRRATDGVPEQRSATSTPTTPPGTGQTSVTATESAREPGGTRLDAPTRPVAAPAGPHDDVLDEDDLASPERHRYTARHYLTFTAVAFVLGFLIWSLTTSTSEPGALSAVAADPTTSLPVPPAALRGEL